MENKLPKIIAIVGPTASGKTDLAIKIGLKFNGEIVSSDSRQIYRGMDIGTAKPEIQRISGNSKLQISNYKQIKNAKSKNYIENPVIVEGIPHYIIDIKSPNENYTVAEYKKGAIKAVNKILKKGRLPILAGGTGLYYKAVTDNLEIPEVKPNPALRLKLEKRIEKEGLENLYRELIELDPEAAYIVDGKNPRRVIRALEVAIITKKPFSAQRKKGKPLFEILKIGIKLPDEKLKKRISSRAAKMIKAGLVEEVSGLIKKYGHKQVAFDAIGYKEIISYLDKKISLEEAAGLINKNTNNFAKRQMTWFKKDKEINWIENEKEALGLVEKFLRDK